MTGATDGLGLATAEKLVALGHKLIVHGRSDDKLQQICDRLNTSEFGQPKSYRADFSNLLEVQQMAEQMLSDGLEIDVLINNAGVYKTAQKSDPLSLDPRFVVNTIAPYYLTKKLLPLTSSSGRIVNLASAAQAAVTIDAVVGKKSLEDQFQSYAQSKTALIMWSNYLAQRCIEGGVEILSINPGSFLASKMVSEGFGTAGKDINIGADILVEACLGARFEGRSGQYFDNDSGDFASPHSDALSEEKIIELVEAMEHLLGEQIL